MEKYSVNVTLDSDDDRELIEFFKNYNGKKVDAIRCLADGYFKSNKALNWEQRQEVKEIVKEMLSFISVNITTKEININSDNITTKESITNNESDNELENIISNCGIDIDF